MQLTLPLKRNFPQRACFIGLSAGLLAGLLTALLARLAMRVVALVEFGSGSFSLGGTAVILVFGALSGPLLGLLYRATFYRLPIRAGWRGLLYMLALLLCLQVPILFIVPDFAAELMVAGRLGLGVFVAFNVAYVLSLVPLSAWLEQRWPPATARPAVETGLTVLLGLLALGGLVTLAWELGGRVLGLVH
jgi:hypothetical protein